MALIAELYEPELALLIKDMVVYDVKPGDTVEIES
jgi:hypothetical protein